MGVRHGHHTADTYEDQFHMRCLRRIANIKWQNMIPNTEVLQRCTQSGFEHHIKRVQLRWSGHQREHAGGVQRVIILKTGNYHNLQRTF